LGARHRGNKVREKLSESVPTRAAGLGIEHTTDRGVSVIMAMGAKAKGQLPNSRAQKTAQEARGLWIDRELLRRHMSPLSKLVPSAQPSDPQDVSRYLELADTLLGTKDQRENTG